MPRNILDVETFMRLAIQVDQAATKITDTATAIETAIEHNPDWKRLKSEDSLAELGQPLLLVNGIIGQEFRVGLRLRDAKAWKVHDKNTYSEKQMHKEVKELEGATASLTKMVDGLKKQQQLAHNSA